ncbi:YheC/YheD family protein [Paenibacillus oryzisoli]|uniref:YheC/YheD family endospore coat-associated protein n=1 Tax=Paenibacillus oryzisoli TaxID=1850517 RepID=UPI003D279483
MKQRIGILLDRATFNGIPWQKTGYESLHMYNKAANELMLKPFYMTLNNIRRKTAIGYTYNGHRYRLERLRIPSVTHNRDITLSKLYKSKLYQLSKSTVLFNRVNRFSKHRIHRILLTNPELKKLLPHTVKYSKLNLESFMIKFSSLFIKPTNGSVGNGIIQISKSSNGSWRINLKKGKPLYKSKTRTQAFLSNFIGNKKYIIQEAIPLALYKTRPYDLRVSVQRGADGNWKLTGIVGKVAAKGRHVTNVAKGGKVRRCEELFQESGFSVVEVKETIRKTALQIAQFLGEKIPHLADIGLDMGIDKDGELKFIEMNARDQRITFKKAKLNHIFYKTYLTPLQYGKYLIERRNKIFS